MSSTSLDTVTQARDRGQGQGRGRIQDQGRGIGRETELTSAHWAPAANVASGGSSRYVRDDIDRLAGDDDIGLRVGLGGGGTRAPWAAGSDVDVTPTGGGSPGRIMGPPLPPLLSTSIEQGGTRAAWAVGETSTKTFLPSLVPRSERHRGRVSRSRSPRQ